MIKFFSFQRLILMASILSLQAVSHAQPGEIGDPAPGLTLPAPDGQIISLSDLQGKVVLIDFWASWCGPCRFANKRIKPIYEQFKSTGFEILGVSIDDDVEAWKRAIKADKITWLQVNQKGGWKSQVALDWNIEALPTTILIDKEGKIVAIDPSEEKLTNLLKKLL